MAKKIDWKKTREDWQALVEDLMREIAKWAREEGWKVHTEQKRLNEENLGQYAVQDLSIQLPPEGRILVEVVGRNTVGAEGRIDISAFPALNRMLLVRTGNHWKVRTDSGIDWPLPWEKKTFIDLAKVLAAA